MQTLTYRSENRYGPVEFPNPILQIWDFCRKASRSIPYWRASRFPENREELVERSSSWTQFPCRYFSESAAVQIETPEPQLTGSA
jgi:hypothetical protein